MLNNNIQQNMGFFLTFFLTFLYIKRETNRFVGLVRLVSSLLQSQSMKLNLTANLFEVLTTF